MKSVHLMDINVLIARLDTAHEHHEKTSSWWHQNTTNGWATCPIIENGVIRILGRASYPGWPGTPSLAANALNGLIASLPGHRFFADDVTLLDKRFKLSLEMASSPDVTDLYLLSLALSHKAKLVTLDARIKAQLVEHGPQAYTLIS